MTFNTLTRGEAEIALMAVCDNDFAVEMYLDDRDAYGDYPETQEELLEDFEAYYENQDDLQEV